MFIILRKVSLNYLTDEEFRKFKILIYNESGIHFSNINRPILESRIRERLKITELEKPLDYYNKVLSDKKETITLLDSVTTNLTRFFRNESHFNALKQEVFPEIIKRKTDDKKIKIWSAGCSTGEEAYSVGIALLEVLKDNYSWNIDILASDISLKSLMVAKKGYYPKERVDSVDNILIEKYFDKVDNGYQIKDFMKDLIRFDYHNLKFDNGERNIDVVFCRNVLIYFDRKAQIETVNKFSLVLNDEGYLFIGHSESLFGMDTDFKFHKINNACVYRKI